MTYQQALFVKDLVLTKEPLNKIAEKFYAKFGKTEHCSGPESYEMSRGRKIYSFSSLQGNDIKYAASILLRERL